MNSKEYSKTQLTGLKIKVFYYEDKRKQVTISIGK